MKLFTIVLSSLFTVGNAFGQVITATISGVMKDETGAILAGAAVEVKNVDTGIGRTVVTDSAGRFSAPQLSVGTYEVQAELAGFKKEIRSGIVLSVGRQAAVDFVLQVGAVTEQITVAGEAPLVETSNASLGTLVGESAIRELPLTETKNLELRSEVFNLLNHANFAIPNSSNRTVVGQTGVITGAG